MEAATTSSAGPRVPAYQRYRVMWPLVPAMTMVLIDFHDRLHLHHHGPDVGAVGRAFQQDFADACQSAFAAGGAIMFVAFLVALAFMESGRETATE